MTARWLTPDDTAAYIGVRVHELPRLVKAGKLPAPSRHLGPRRPRYDREALDKAFGEDSRSSDIDKAVNDAVQQILSEKPKRRRRSAYSAQQDAAGAPAASVVALFRG